MGVITDKISLKTDGPSAAAVKCLLAKRLRQTGGAEKSPADTSFDTERRRQMQVLRSCGDHFRAGYLLRLRSARFSFGMAKRVNRARDSEQQP